MTLNFKQVTTKNHLGNNNINKLLMSKLMKNQFLLALMCMAAMLTGCNNENNENAEDLAGVGKTTACFNVSADGGAKTRATVDDLTRYVMEIYKGATAEGGTLVSHTEQSTGEFTDVELVDQQQYTVLFWADYGTPTAKDGTPVATNEYNASSLKAAILAKQPTQAAYAGLSRFTVGTDDQTKYTKVTLTHAVAQVNFKQTEALTTANNTLKVTFPRSYSLNVDGNAVTEIAGSVEYTFTRSGDKTAGTLGTSYIIAATGTPKTMMDITATLNGETTKSISNAPFERNYKTNISGAYSNKYSATLTASCEDTWGTPDNDELMTLKITDLDHPIEGDGKYIIKGSDMGAIKDKTIILKGNPTVIFEDVSISNSSYDAAAIKVESGTPTITLKGNNEFTLASNADRNNPFIWLDSKDANVVIDGEGSGTLTLNRSLAAYDYDETYYAMIGGAMDGNAGNITIRNITLNIPSFQGAAAAAIGVGTVLEGPASCGNITIDQCEINIGKDEDTVILAAFIGTGTNGENYGSTCGTITITLKTGDTKEAFEGRLKGKLNVAEKQEKIGLGFANGCSQSRGEIIWKSADGTVLETIPAKIIIIPESSPSK